MVSNSRNMTAARDRFKMFFFSCHAIYVLFFWQSQKLALYTTFDTESIGIDYQYQSIDKLEFIDCKWTE